MLRKHVWLLFVPVALLPPAIGAEEAAFTVHLSPEHQTINRGDTPSFIVTVEAQSSVRMLRLDRRGDLNDNYAELRVTHAGKPVDTPVFISDPGPVSDKDDYIELKSGQTMTWTESGSPKALNELPAGTYTVVERVQVDWNAPLVESNAVTYEVRERK